MHRGWLSYNVKPWATQARTGATREPRRDLAAIRCSPTPFRSGAQVYSAVPSALARLWTRSASIALLEHAISLAKKSSSLALRAWLYARRAEEHAVGRGIAVPRTRTSSALIGDGPPGGRFRRLPHPAHLEGRQAHPLPRQWQLSSSATTPGRDDPHRKLDALPRPTCPSGPWP